MIKGRENLEKKIYLTCPVRKATEEDLNFLSYYVKLIEEGDIGVYYPKWDTKQDGDPIGVRICSDNRSGIFNSKEVHKYLSGTSEGSMFDDGMCFMDEKPIKIINPEFLEGCVDHVKNFIRGYCFDFPNNTYERLLERRNEIRNSEIVEYQFWGKTPEFLFDFGMTFMAEKPIRLLNSRDVLKTPHKSFSNVLLYLKEN